jgi:hypothetical protein
MDAAAALKRRHFDGGNGGRSWVLTLIPLGIRFPVRRLRKMKNLLVLVLAAGLGFSAYAGQTTSHTNRKPAMVVAVPANDSFADHQDISKNLAKGITVNAIDATSYDTNTGEIGYFVYFSDATCATYLYQNMVVGGVNGGPETVHAVLKTGPTKVSCISPR